MSVSCHREKQNLKRKVQSCECIVGWEPSPIQPLPMGQRTDHILVLLGYLLKMSFNFEYWKSVMFPSERASKRESHSKSGPFSMVQEILIPPIFSAAAPPRLPSKTSCVSQSLVNLPKFILLLISVSHFILFVM